MNMNLWMRAALSLKADGTYQAFSPEAWQYAGEMTLLGMGMIFSVLAILWGILAIFKLVFAGKTPKEPKVSKVKVEKAKEAPVVDDTKSAVAASAPSSATSEAQSNDALIAILTAAVTAYREEEGASGSFRVVSFKRTGGAWNTKR